MTPKEAVKELHDRVRQCFTRHKFVTFGDAMGWWHEASYETQVLEAGEQGISKFGTDIQWITGLFGPKELVDYKVMATRKVPKLKPVKVTDEDAEEITVNPPKSKPKPNTKSQTKRKAGRRKRRF